MSEVAVDIGDSTAVIRYDAGITNMDTIKKVMEDGTYPVTALEEMD